jgi:hypothetical protein
MVKLALVVALVTGCSIPDVTFMTGDNAAIDAGVDTPAVTRQVSARWTFNHRQTGEQFPCPPSAVSAQVLVNPWDPVAQMAGATQTFTAKCSPNLGTFLLPPGTYVAHMVVQDDIGTNLVVSDFQYVDTTVGTAIAEFSFFDDAGFFAFSWALLDHAGGARVTCAQAGISNAGWIELVATPSTGGPITARLNNCDHHIGSTPALPPGSYTFQVRGREAGAIVTTTVVPPAVTLPANAVYVFIDTVAIPVH